MGRSVSYATGSTVVCFQDKTNLDDSCCSWDTFREDIKSVAELYWPSLCTCDKWLDREDRAILENDHAYIGVSEYCGLVSIWLVHKNDNDHPELSEHWCRQISAKFEVLFSEYRKIATASNGESFYERV